MKGMYLGRRFYRQMFGAVLLTPDTRPLAEDISVKVRCSSCKS